MKIEEAIKQKKFDDEHQKLAINIVYTAKQLEQMHSQLLKKYGLTMPQFNILRILKGQLPESASINLLIDRMIDKMSNASRIVDKLEVKELVKRVNSKEDRRSVKVIITTKGLTLLKKITKEAPNPSKSMGSLNTKEAHILNNLLDKLRIGLNKAN